MRGEKLMNTKVNTRIIVISSILLISILISACGNKKSENKSGKVSGKINQKIVFIQQFTNYSDTYINRGYFIDNEGNKVTYDLSFEDKKYANIKELLPYLEKLQYDKSESRINQKDLLKYYDLLYKIDHNYKLDEKSYGADQGSDAFYGVVYASNNSPNIVLIDETGDWVKKNTDSNAIKIKEGLR